MPNRPPNRHDRRLKLRRTTPILLLAMLHAGSVSAADVMLITNRDGGVDTPLSRTEVADLFLGRSANPYQIVVFDQADVALRERFYAQYTGMSLSRVRAYWAKRVFTGRGHPPPTIETGDIPDILDKVHPVLTYAPSPTTDAPEMAKPVGLREGAE